jgi:hypothetical protein
MGDAEEGVTKTVRNIEAPPSPLSKVMNSMAVTALMTVLTIYCLFSEDVKTSMVTPTCTEAWGGDLGLIDLDNVCDAFTGSDPSFVFISLFAFILFFLEVVASSITTPGYLSWPDPSMLIYNEKEPKSLAVRLSYAIPGSFYFWLDVLSTISLIFEIPAINPIVTDPIEIEAALSETGGGDSGSSGFSDNAESARAGKASRAGARAGKVVKIIRMVRARASEAGASERSEREEGLLI